MPGRVAPLAQALQVLTALLVLVLVPVPAGSVAPAGPCRSKTPGPVRVAGYGLSRAGCIGAQGANTTAQLAVTVDCGEGRNATKAAAATKALCDATLGCAAFSVISPAYHTHNGALLCELHPETIAESSQANQWWNVWQRDTAVPGKWPYAPGHGPPKPPPPPPPPPAPPPSPRSSLAWTTPSVDVTGSMPLGNGRLGVNVWADANDTVWLLLSHVDALDENTNLAKLGRVAVRAAMDQAPAGPPQDQGNAGAVQPFLQQMHLGNGSVHIDLPRGVSVDVYVDANTNAVRVASSSVAGAAPHRLEATVEVWRTKDGPYPWSDSGTWCPSLHPAEALVIHADTVVPGDGGVAFYHRNLGAWTKPYFDADLESQRMPPGLENPLTNQTFGGLLTGGTGSKMVPGGPAKPPLTMVSAAPATTQSLVVAGAAGRYDGGARPFLDGLAAAAAEPADFGRHAAWWSSFWASSDLTVTAAPSPGDPVVAAAADRVTLLDKVNRAAFHSMAMGAHAIKFNAYGIFSAYPSPREDYRVWGPCQWFQNIRLPYYHMLADGRFEALKSLFGFYAALLPLSKARTKAWFGINGTFFPETKQQTGLYASGSLGWGCTGAGSPGAAPTPGNTYIRYHREGGLELSLLALDWLAHTGDTRYFQDSLLPQIEAYVDYYAEHFDDDPATGKLDIFPAQALETWQCASMPPNRSTCVTNPMPEVAGLHAVLPRLLALDAAAGATAGVRRRWAALWKRVPALPVGDVHRAHFHIVDGLVPGERLPASVSNSENAGLYAVHPYRVVGLLANRTLGVRSFEQRRNTGNTGWSEDFMEAALLGLANETAGMAIARATVAPYTGYRWVGFQAGIGAGGPITDHGGVATAGLRCALFQTLTLTLGRAHASAGVLLPRRPPAPALGRLVPCELHARLQNAADPSCAAPCPGPGPA